MSQNGLESTDSLNQPSWMAKLDSVMYWSLKLPCWLWNSEDEEKRKKVLVKAKLVSAALTKPTEVSLRWYEALSRADVFTFIFEDFFIEVDREEKCFPLSGFRISDVFSEYGGFSKIRADCAACPANTIRGGIAGCTGLLCRDWSDERMRSILRKMHLEEAFNGEFPLTQEYWYGMWIKTPVSIDGLKILRSLFEELLHEDKLDLSDPSSNYENRNLIQFINALNASERNGIPLDVQARIPQTTEFGIQTIFPHCPVCKKESVLARFTVLEGTEKWQVCGEQFDLQATSFESRSEMHHEAGLRELLGDNGFKDFCRKFLHYLGLPHDQIEELIDQNQELFQNNLLRERYVRDKLYFGLEPTEGRNSSRIYFRADAFREILRRCKNLRIMAQIECDSLTPGMNDQKFASFDNIYMAFESWSAEATELVYAGNFYPNIELLNQFKEVFRRLISPTSPL